MRNNLLLLLLLFSGLCQAKDKYPEWMNDVEREKMFPSSLYYCGYAFAELDNDDSVEETLERLRQSAYGNLLSKISVTIQHNASDSTRDIVGDRSSYSESVYSSSTQLTTRVTEIPGIEVKTFTDAESKVAAVLAYVKKDGLSTKFQRQLITQITRLNVRVEDAEQYLKSGDKTRTRETLEEARTLLATAENTRNTMSAINANLSPIDLMESEWRDAEKRIIAIEKELNRSVRVLLNCTLGDEKENTLYNKLSGELYRNGCEIVDSAAQAEWVVDVNATVEPYNKVTMGDYIFYYSIATATLKITDSDGNLSYSDEIRCKGSHTKNYDFSTADAVRKLAAKISELVKTTVQK